MLPSSHALQYAAHVKCGRYGNIRSAVNESVLNYPKERQSPVGVESINKLRDVKSPGTVQEIVRGNISHRFVIDSSGRLKKVSNNDSIVKHQAALVLSRAHRSLTHYDFQRLLPVGNTTLTKESQIAVLPFASSRERRRSSWILLFASEREAKLYQDTALQQWSSILKSVLMARSSFNSLASYDIACPAVSPTASIHDCTVSSPCQSLSLVAYLSPFARKIKRKIDKYSHVFGHDGSISQPAAVELRVRGRRIPALTVTDIRKLIQSDASQQQHQWRLAAIPHPVFPVSGPFLRVEIPQQPKGDISVDTTQPANSWRITFKSQSDARRFARLWHRKSLASFGGIYSSHLSVFFETEVAMDSVPSP